MVRNDWILLKLSESDLLMSHAIEMTYGVFHVFWRNYACVYPKYFYWIILLWKKHQRICRDFSNKLRWFKKADNSVNSAWSWKCKTTHTKQKPSMLPILALHRSLAYANWPLYFMMDQKYGWWTFALVVQWLTVFGWAYETCKMKVTHDAESCMQEKSNTTTITNTTTTSIAPTTFFSTQCKICIERWYRIEWWLLHWPWRRWIWHWLFV